MFCEKCGAENSKKAVFCEECGAKLEKAQVTVGEEVKQSGRKPFSKFLMIEAVVCVVLIVCVVSIYKGKLSPERAASDYVEAYVGKNWGIVYDMTGFDAGKKEFLKKEAYVTGKAIEESEEKSKSAVEIVSVNKMTSSSKTITFNVAYRQEDELENMDVRLKKKGLGWQVQPEEEFFDIHKKGQLTVPTGASVSVDKIELQKDMEGLKIEKGEVWDVYELPEMFGTMHYIEVSAKGAESFKSVQSFSSPVKVTLEYSEEEYKKLTERAWKDLETILDGAINDKRYKDMKVFADIHPQMEEHVREDFEALREYGYEYGDDQYRIIKQVLSNVEVVVKDEHYATVDGEIPCIMVEFKGDTSAEELRMSTGSVEAEEETEYYALCYEKGKSGWKLIDTAVYDYFPETDY